MMESDEWISVMPVTYAVQGGMWGHWPMGTPVRLVKNQIESAVTRQGYLCLTLASGRVIDIANESGERLGLPTEPDILV